MSKTAVYAGTFDPVTHGHMDIIRRAARLFDALVLAVAQSASKQPSLTLSQRLSLVRDLTADIDNVSVCEYSGLTVALARSKGASVLVRGIRSSQDLDFELALADMNQKMAPEIETVFLLPTEQHRLVSATVVREIAQMGGDLTPFVDERVAKILLNKR